LIELPSHPQPNGLETSLLDFGQTIRPSTGAAVERLNRKGSRYRLAVSYPPIHHETARVFIARLLRAKTQGIRIALPLLHYSQGSPGAGVVVDGAGQTGNTLALRGFTPGYMAKEGYWLSIESATGQHYLHNIATGGMADATGDLEISLDVELRHPFADGDSVHIAKPMVEGFIDGEEWSWSMPVERLVAIQFVMEEAA